MTLATGGSAAAPLTDEVRGIALAHFEHVEKQVGLATTTAALIVTATALLLNAYLLIAKNFDMFTASKSLGEREAFFVSGVSLVVGAILSLIAVFPNLSSRWFALSDIQSLLFFGTVGQMSRDEYLGRFEYTGKNNGFDREILVQTWAKSRWLIRMFRFTQAGIVFVIAGAIIGACVLVYDVAILEAPVIIPAVNQPAPATNKP